MKRTIFALVSISLLLEGCAQHIAAMQGALMGCRRGGTKEACFVGAAIGWEAARKTAENKNKYNNGYTPP